MIKIYICEDDANQLTKIQTTVSRLISENKYPMSISAYSTNPTDIIDAVELKSPEYLGLYFLDIELNADIDGFELAKKIRELDPRGFIVFVTTHSELLHLTFEYLIEQLGYIIKASTIDMDIQIEKCMANAVAKYKALKDNHEANQTISFSTLTKEYHFNPKELIYITLSSIPHTIEICSKHTIIQSRGNISDTLKKLPKYFVQISRDTIINVYAVSHYDKITQKLRLKNDVEFDASSRRYTKIRRILSKKAMTED